MQTALRYPVDYDSLHKGFEFTVEDLERITRTSRTKEKIFQLKVMSLQSQIEREMADRGLVVCVAIVRGVLRILTDAEAVSYTQKNFQSHRRGMHRHHVKACAIDVSALNDEQKNAHDRNIELQGKYIQADAEVTKQLRLAAHHRTVPKLN